MQIVPVLDMKEGQIVQGVRGERHLYRPIHTPLAQTANPLDVAQALLRLFPFRALYVADLDAITGGAADRGLYRELAASLGGVELWIDCGIACEADAERLLAVPALVPVVGSETLRETSFPGAPEWRERCILSLDIGAEGFRGEERLLHEPASWPRRVIAMTLARVGSGEGPDLQRLEAILSLTDQHAVYAAGGVRGPSDLEAVEKAGGAGVLVASALHDGRIGPADLCRFS